MKPETLKETPITMTTDRKTYSSVSEMVREISEDKSFSEEFAKESRKRLIVNHLFAARSAKGMTQQAVADKLSVTQSWVSKLESGIDEDLRLGDLQKYLSALGQDSCLFILPKSWQSFQQIKCHAFMIKEALAKLVQLAGDDETIEQGVSKAHVETLVNLVKFVVDSAKALPSFKQSMPGLIDLAVVDCDYDSKQIESHKTAEENPNGLASTS